MYLNVSPSFHGIEEANAVCWAADLNQILPAHPQQISTCNDSRTSVLLPSRDFLALRSPAEQFTDHGAYVTSSPRYLRSWRRALRKGRTCDGSATAECPVVRTTAEGAT